MTGDNPAATSASEDRHEFTTVAKPRMSSSSVWCIPLNRSLCVSLLVLALISVTLSGCSSSRSTVGSGPSTGTVTIQGTPAGVTLKFQNQRPDAATVPAIITFGGGGDLIGTQNDANHTPLVKGTSYPLNSLASGVNITTYDDGRIFLSLGPDSPRRRKIMATRPFRQSGPHYRRFHYPLGQNRAHHRAQSDRYHGVASSHLAGLLRSSSRRHHSGGSQTPAHLTWNAGADTATVFTKLGAPL